MNASESPVDLGPIRALFPELEILGVAGRGGIGTVYRARRPDVGQDVALKVLHPELASDRAFVARFRREAESLAALEHPFLVGILAQGEVEGVHYLLLEWCGGGTLRRLLSGDRGDRLRALDVLARVCEVVEHAHALGIVHRDLKPENVLLDVHGYPRVADFGLAGSVAASGARLTVRGDVLGSPRYMAPEQLAGGETSAATDVFALGVMLYEVLTGEPPVGRFRAPSEAEGLRPDLDETILAALDPDPGRRPAVETLRAAVAGDPDDSREPTRSAPESRALERTVAPVSGTLFAGRLGADTLFALSLLLPFGWMEVVGDRSENLVSWGWQTTVDLFGSGPLPLWSFLPVFLVDAVFWLVARGAGTRVRPRAVVHATSLVAAVLFVTALVSLVGLGSTVQLGDGTRVRGWSGPGFFALLLATLGVVVTSVGAELEARRQAEARLLGALRKTRRLTVGRRAARRRDA